MLLLDPPPCCLHVETLSTILPSKVRWANLILLENVDLTQYEARATNRDLGKPRLRLEISRSLCVHAVAR